MPASLRLPDGSLLVATRCCGDGRGGRRPTRQWMDVYHTADEGRTFTRVSRPVDEASNAHGNPPTLTLLADRSGVVLAYGHRERPYGIRYKVGSLALSLSLSLSLPLSLSLSLSLTVSLTRWARSTANAGVTR